MKVNKVQAVIYMFSLLMTKKRFSKEEIQRVISIRDVTLRRYIQELRAYLINFNEPYELIYNRKNDEYYLKKLVI